MVTMKIPNIMKSTIQEIFKQVVDFRVDNGDHVLGVQFTTASRNATYRLKTIKNEITVLVRS